MNYIAFSCKLIGKRFKTICVRIPQRNISVKSSVKALIGIGALKVVPSVSAQSELKNSEKDVENRDPDENPGWERVKAMYNVDEGISKELTAVSQSTCCACFIGLLYGGVTNSRIAFRDFMERNQATIFENHIDAKRRLQNHVTIHFGRGGFRWAARLSFFTSGFMLFLTTMTAYRGYTSVIDYMGSGLVVGGLLRFRLGPPAILVGSTVGCILGGLCGLSTQALFYLTDSSLDDVMAFQYELDKKRSDLFKEAESESKETQLDIKTVRLLETRDESNKTKEI